MFLEENPRSFHSKLQARLLRLLANKKLEILFKAPQLTKCHSPSCNIIETMSFSHISSFGIDEFYINSFNVNKTLFFSTFEFPNGRSRNENEHVDDRLPRSNDFQGTIAEGDKYNVDDDS